MLTREKQWTRAAPCYNRKLLAIVQHEQSARHLAALPLLKNAKADEALRKLDQANFTAFESTFKILYYQAIERVRLLSFDFDCILTWSHSFRASPDGR